MSELPVTCPRLVTDRDHLKSPEIISLKEIPTVMLEEPLYFLGREVIFTDIHREHYPMYTNVQTTIETVLSCYGEYEPIPHRHKRDFLYELPHPVIKSLTHVPIVFVSSDYANACSFFGARIYGMVRSDWSQGPYRRNLVENMTWFRIPMMKKNHVIFLN